MSRKRLVYLDNTATTRTRREVAADIKNYFVSEYANPSSIHLDGLIARGSIEMARERIAKVLNCLSEEIVFTGSGSEANNLAIRGAINNSAGGKHIITSQIEHSSVLNTCRALEREGCQVTYLAVDSQGHVDMDELTRSIRSDTALVSIGWVNNEIGTVQDVESIRRITRAKGILWHTDAVQALPYLTIDLADLGADLVSASGHKLYAPKGVGFLFVRKGTTLTPLIYGGEQEFGLRSGTENIPYIVGLSRAINLNYKEKQPYVKKLYTLRDRLIKGVLSQVPDTILTGDPNHRAANHASFCIKGINGKMLVKALSQQGFAVSSGAACSSPRNDPSHVIVACKISDEYLYGSLRVTLGRYNSRSDVDRFIKVLSQVVARMKEEPTAYQKESIFISIAEFRAKQAAGIPLQILDVRQVRYPAVDIPGSQWIPSWRLKAQLKRLDSGAETIVVCYQGDILSPEVQQMLVNRGFSNVKVLKGGIFSYVGYTH